MDQKCSLISGLGKELIDSPHIQARIKQVATKKNSVSPKRICLQHLYVVRLSMSCLIIQFSTHGFDNITFVSDIGLFEILKISHGVGGWLDGSVGGWVIEC